MGPQGPKSLDTLDRHASTVRSAAVKFATSTQHGQTMTFMGSLHSPDQRGVTHRIENFCTTLYSRTQTLQDGSTKFSMMTDRQ